jgi:hypothetical protein
MKTVAAVPMSLGVLGVVLFSAFDCYGQVTISQSVQNDTSPPLRDLVAAAPASLAPDEPQVIPLMVIPPAEGFQPDVADSVLQTSAGPNASATVAQNFDGIPSDGFAPPDPNGSAGLTQYVQMVNVEFAIYSKTGTLLLGPAPIHTLWAGFGGPCSSNDGGDPIVNYDRIADRWVISQLEYTFPFGPFSTCVAVSTTSDATGPYNRYQFTYANFNDYPKIGVWPDAYYAAYNMFNGQSGAFLGSQACALDRSTMLVGLPASQICFQLSPAFGGLLPTDLDGSTPPPAGSPNFYLNFGASKLNLWKFHVDFTTPADSTFTGPTSISVASFTPLCNGFLRGQCVPQPAPGATLESLGDRLMYRLAYRNFHTHESLVTNHSISTGARWYELQDPNGTVNVFQSGTFAPDASTRWMGSIAMDQSGDIALGYSVSSSTLFPSIRYTGREPGDPLGTLQTEGTIFDGVGSQSGNLHRWGDYSAMQVDPVDDCTFWYTNQYEPATGSFNWRTRIASFKFTRCGCPPPVISDASASPDLLWPPNHKFVDVTIAYQETSDCPSTCTLSVTSNEAGADDWIVMDAHHVLIRAERDGAGSGRIYAITITCTNSGGTTTRTVTVLVPHDQRGAEK